MDLTKEFKGAFPFLGSIDPKFAQELALSAKKVEFPSGKFLFHPGDPCTVLVFVLAGSIRVFLDSGQGRAMTLYRIERSQTCILSTSSILGNANFPAFAQVEEMTQAILIPAEKIRNWIQNQEPWRTFLFSLMTSRLGSLMLTVEEVAFQRMDLRLSRLLIEQADGTGWVESTHQQLADELGSAREVISRLLKDFEAKGWVKRDRSGLKINPSLLPSDLW